MYSRLRKVAIWYCISHAVAGSLYIPLHTIIPLILNFFSSEILNLNLEDLPLPHENFWFVLSVSAMYMISYTAYLVWKDEKNANAWKIIILSKGVSSLFFLLYFFLRIRAFAYLFGVFVDAPLFAIALYIWKIYRKQT